jgi:hypothetical protein
VRLKLAQFLIATIVSEALGVAEVRRCLTFTTRDIVAATSASLAF